MARYIDADKLVDFKFAYVTNERYKGGKRKSEEEIYAYKVGYNEAIDNIIQFATTSDVVEAVRCKECFWHNSCRYEQYLGLDGFCSRGERKDEDFVRAVRCKDCKYSEHWYNDKRRCFLWNEAGIDVFEDGFCSYGERRE